MGENLVVPHEREPWGSSWERTLWFLISENLGVPHGREPCGSS